MHHSGIGAAITLVCAAAMAPASLGAQRPTVDTAVLAPQMRTGGECASGLVGGGPRCAPGQRLVIDLRASGAGLPDRGQLLAAVGLGADAAGLFALPLDRATRVDSALYGVVEVERGTDGAFRIDTRLAGVRARRTNACRSGATGSDGEVAFGASLAVHVMRLARCAQRERNPSGGS
jgi:hypothetical protein